MPWTKPFLRYERYCIAEVFIIATIRTCANGFSDHSTVLDVLPRCLWKVPRACRGSSQTPLAISGCALITTIHHITQLLIICINCANSSNRSRRQACPSHSMEQVSVHIIFISWLLGSSSFLHFSPMCFDSSEVRRVVSGGSSSHWKGSAPPRRWHRQGNQMVLGAQVVSVSHVWVGHVLTTRLPAVSSSYFR